MALWNKLFGKSSVPDQRRPAVESSEPTARPAQPSGAGVSDDVSDMVTVLRETKRPRYAHMAKLCELSGHYGEAESNYCSLIDATQHTLGADHLDVATALHEFATLNKNQIFSHAPAIQIIYNTIGREAYILAPYQSAMQIRKEKLGTNHPAYAQSLFALAVYHIDSGVAQERDKAIPMITEAIAIQKSSNDRLSAAMSMAYLGELQAETPRAIETFQEALTYLPYQTLQPVDIAKEMCECLAGMTDLEKRDELIRQVRELQARFTDSYFEMCFRLTAERSHEIVLDVLRLHRHQHRKTHLGTRARLLTNLADIASRHANQEAAVRFSAEAQEIEKTLAKEQASFERR